MADDPEPARPPPPKSYVPINLLEGPAPTLPPRPADGEGSEEPKMPPRPQSSPTGAEPQAVMSEPAELVPVKPERQKNKKAPPKPPAPYEVAVKVVKEAPSSDTPSSDPKPAPRRHTMAAPSRPSRPKPPSTPEAKTTDFDRPKLHPPDIMTESLYATVKKPPKAAKSSDFPAPNAPPPPPPYSGKSMVSKSATLSQDRSPTPEYMPVSGVTDASKPSAAPPPSRPARPPAASDNKTSLPASSRSSTLGSAGSSSKSKKTKGKKKLEIVVMDAKPMDGDLIPSPPSSSVSPTSPDSTSAVPPIAMPTVPPTKPPSGPPAKRPSPPQPKRPPPEANQHPPPARRPSPPQPNKNPPASRPSPPQPNKNPPAARPSPPQPNKNPPAARPSPPQPNKNPPAARPSPPQPNKNLPASRPSPPQPKKSPPAPRPSPPPPKKNLPASRPSPPQPPQNPSRPTPPQPPRNPSRPTPPQPPTSTTTPQPNAHSGATNSQSEPSSVTDGSSSVPPVKPSRALSKQKSGPDKRPPPPRPAGKNPQPRKELEKPLSQASKSAPDPNIMKQLSELGPPPDEEPPEIPEEVVNTAAALLDSDSEIEEENMTSELPGKEEHEPTTTNLPQTEPLEEASKETQEKPVTVLSEEVLAPKKAPTPAGRPPPPKPVSRLSQKETEGSNSSEESNGSPVLPDEGSADEKKTTESVDITDSVGANAQPPKKAPTRRPPPPRQSSIQHGSSSKSPAGTTTAASEGKKKNTEQDESAEAARDKPAPVVKRPAGPRPMSRPRSMVVKPTSRDPPSNETDIAPPAAAAEAANTNKKEGEDSVPKKSPVVKRPPAPRPSSRPRSMLVKSATISEDTPTHSAASTSQKEPGSLTDSFASKKKASPQVKRPPAPRPPAPRKNPASNKQAVGTISEAATEDRVPNISDKSEEQDGNEPESDTAGDKMPSEEQPTHNASATPEPERKTEDVKKPLQRPPPPSGGRRRKTKFDSDAADSSSDNPASSLLVTQAGTESSHDEPEAAPKPEQVQEEEKKPSTVPVSPNKKLAISKPPPPISAKPKSRSPTPSGASGTPSPPPPTSPTTTSEIPASGVSSAPDSLIQDEMVKKDAPSLAPPPSMKRPSVKKPPPPVTKKPKSRSPTPASLEGVAPLSPPISPTPAIDDTPPESSSHTSEPTTPPQKSPDSASTETQEPPVEEQLDQKEVESQPAQDVNEKNNEQEGHANVTAPTEGEGEVDSVQDMKESRQTPPARPAPTARARPPPPRAPQRAKLNKTPSSDSSEDKARPPSSPSQTRTGSFKGKKSPTAKRAPSPKQPKRSGGGSSTESSPSTSHSKKLNKGGSPKSSPKPSRPTAMPTRSPSLRKKNEPHLADEVDSGSSSPVASRPQPPLPQSTSRPSGPPKPPAPASKSGPPKPPAPSARPGPPKPPTPTATSRNLASPTSTSRPPPPTARPEPTRRSSQGSTKGHYATPSSKKPPGKPEPSVPPSLPPRPTPGHPLYKYVCSEPHGIANTHHDANDEDELSYQEGDVIELIEKVDDYWYYAANADTGLCEGLVVASDLNIVKRIPGKTTVEGFEDGPCAVATHKFEGQSLDELSFESGELIMLTSRYGKSWFRGKLINGREGIFPMNFVEVVEELPESAYEEPASAKKAEPDVAAVAISGPYCEVTFSFTAENPGELDLVEGDMVELVRRENEEWLVGRIGGREGSFPANFVNIVKDFPPGWKHEDSSKSSASPPATAVSEAHTSTALYDFDGQDGELTFKAGDKIQVVAKVNEEWVLGKMGTSQGMFPMSFVDSVPPSLPPMAEKEPDKKEEKKESTGLCKALYEFTGESGEELSFEAGETIVTLEKVNNEWLKGRIGTKEGMFPAAFVEIISDIPTSPPPPSASPQKTTQQATSGTSPGKKKVTQPLMDDLMPKGIALSDFQSSDISFTSGDVLLLLTKEPGNKFMGENTRTGDLGIFPASYVDVKVPLP